MGLLKKLKKAKGKVTSFRGDANALKSKFGIGRSLSNKFDQRISDDKILHYYKETNPIN